MKINTKHFGEIEVDEGKVIEFSNGILGFEDSKKYVMLSKKDNGQLFCWLQSVDDADTAFAVTVPYVFYPDYKPNVADEDLAKIGINGQDEIKDLSVFSIMVIPDETKNTTINLKAPVVINQATNKGGQFIASNAEYDVRHKLTDLVGLYA